MQWLAFPLPTWKSSSTNFGHKTYDPKYFHRFSPDLQAILCDISASVGARAEKDLYVSAVDNWAAGTEAYLFSRLLLHDDDDDRLSHRTSEMYSAE